MHFTYTAHKGDLQQGDLLNRSDELEKVLEEFHPYFAKHDDYVGLMVLTQSCDLARHGGGKCKSRYITLAAVRPVETAISRELGKHQRSSVEKNGNLCSAKKQHWMKDFLVKLLNNNIPEYFYLAEDPEIGLQRACVAFLQLAIPIKANHYKVCLDARISQLKEIFQAKLGWLVGNMYSRVGTPDWVPIQKPKKDFDNFVEETLNSMCLWVDDGILERLKKELQQRRKDEGGSYNFAEDELLDLIREYAKEKETRMERVIDVILQSTKETIPTISGDDAEKLRRQLTYNEEVRRFLGQT